MRSLSRKIALFLFVIAAWYGWTSFWYWRDPPKISRNFAAELNKPVLAQPISAQAWPIYRDAMIAMAKDQPEARRKFEYAADNVAAAKDPVIIEYLRRHAAQLDRVRAAAKLPSLGHTLSDVASAEDRLLVARHLPAERIAEFKNERVPNASENPSLLGVLLQPSGETTELRQNLCIDALVAADEGDAERALGDLAALIGLARQLREIPLLVNELTSISCYLQALQTWGEMASRHPQLFSEAELSQLEQAVRNYGNGEIRLRFDGERAAFADIVQRMFTDDGSGDGYFYLPAMHLGIGEGPKELNLWHKFIAPLTKGNLYSRRWNIDEHNRLIGLIEAETRRPYWQCRCKLNQTALGKYKNDSRAILINLMAIAERPLHITCEDAIQQRDAALTGIALFRFRISQERWPAKLDELVPKHLPHVPKDRLCGADFRYRLIDDSPVVYSVGFDGDDDHARAAIVSNPRGDTPKNIPWHGSFPRYIDQEVEGDLILWPMQPPAARGAVE